MKKITLWLFALFTCWQMSAQTGTIVVGVNDGTPNTATGYPSPMQDYYKTGRVQFLYTASELLGAGLVAGPITEIGWVVTSNNTSTLQENYTISMKSTASTALTTTFETGASVVYGPTDFTPSATGNVMFTLATPFVWDGTSNVIIEICAGLATGTFTQNVSCANSTTTGIKSVYYRVDTGTTTCTNATGTTSTDRPLLVATGNVASCLAPLNLVSANVAAYTADISWDASTSNPGIGYEYVVSTSNIAPTGAGTATTNVYASVSSLLPVTTYYVFVRSNCAAGEFSGWNGPISFTTACAPITVFPHLEPFNTYLPSVCWSEGDGGDITAGPVTVSATAASWIADGLGNVGTTGAARVTLDATGDNDWIISPQYTIPATGYELKFSAAATQAGGTAVPTTPWETDDFVEVLISSTGTTNWTVLHTYTDINTPSNTGSINILDLDAYAGQTVRFAYRAVEGASNGAASVDFSFDNFEIRLTPACSEPFGIVTANITDTSVDMSWNAPATAPSVGYEYVVSTSNTVPVTAGTPVTTTFASPSGLLSNTTYYVFVRSDCGASGFSTWTGPVSFTTQCGAYAVPMTENFTTFLPSVCWFNRFGGDLTTGPTSLTGSGWVADGFANAGTTGAIKNEIWTTGANDWFISPRIAIPATGYELKFDAAATQFGNANVPTNAWEADDYIQVLVSTTGTTNWTVLHTYDNSNQPSNAGTPNILDLDAYAGQNIRIAFRAVEGSTNGSADIDFSIDNFQIRLTPTCI